MLDKGFLPSLWGDRDAAGAHRWLVENGFEFALTGNPPGDERFETMARSGLARREPLPEAAAARWNLYRIESARDRPGPPTER